jgi:hypothetical protein
MAGTEGSGKKWLTCTCFGCLGLIVLVLLVLAGVFGTAWVGVNNEQVAEQTLQPQIPAGEVTDREPGGRPGRVELRLTSGEFHIRPARPGESLRVEARYDENTYSLTERFVDGDERWTYGIDFERKGSMLMSMLKSAVGGVGSRVEIFLPADVPLELTVELRQGGSELDLGGLWLTAAEFDFGMGGFNLEISEPLREPMDSLSIKGDMGGFNSTRLGDASPRRLDVEVSMGGLNLDLRGDWVVDSEVSIQVSQGGGAVQLPRDVNIVGIDSVDITPRGDDEVPLPTLTFSVSNVGGEIEFIE